MQAQRQSHTCYKPVSLGIEHEIAVSIFVFVFLTAVQFVLVAKRAPARRPKQKKNWQEAGRSTVWPNRLKHMHAASQMTPLWMRVRMNAAQRLPTRVEQRSITLCKKNLSVYCFYML